MQDHWRGIAQSAVDVYSNVKSISKLIQNGEGLFEWLLEAECQHMPWHICFIICYVLLSRQEDAILDSCGQREGCRGSKCRRRYARLFKPPVACENTYLTVGSQYCRDFFHCGLGSCWILNPVLWTHVFKKTFLGWVKKHQLDSVFFWSADGTWPWVLAVPVAKLLRCT